MLFRTQGVSALSALWSPAAVRGLEPFNSPRFAVFQPLGCEEFHPACHVHWSHVTDLQHDISSNTSPPPPSRISEPPPPHVFSLHAPFPLGVSADATPLSPPPASCRHLTSPRSPGNPETARARHQSVAAGVLHLRAVALAPRAQKRLERTCRRKRRVGHGRRRIGCRGRRR